MGTVRRRYVQYFHEFDRLPKTSPHSQESAPFGISVKLSSADLAWQALIHGIAVGVQFVDVTVGRIANGRYSH